MKIGFIGVGNMGLPMAKNLIKAGHSLTVYNRTRGRAEQLEPLGARIAATAGEAASGVEALVTMLADDNAVEEIIFAPGSGAIHSLPAGAGHISMGTIGVQMSCRLTEAHHEKNQHYISAPVLGRPDMAAAGKLFIIAAGPGSQVERFRPLFDVMGQKTFFAAEDAPSANTIKLAANFLFTCVIESLAESFSFVQKSGIEASTFLDILTHSFFTAPAYKNYGDLVAGGIFEPAGFRLSLGFKDNRLLIDAAEEARVPMPIAGVIHDRFLAALAQGMADLDWAAISRISYQEAGLVEAAR